MNKSRDKFFKKNQLAFYSNIFQPSQRWRFVMVPPRLYFQSLIDQSLDQNTVNLSNKSPLHHIVCKMIPTGSMMVPIDQSTSIMRERKRKKRARFG